LLATLPGSSLVVGETPIAGAEAHALTSERARDRVRALEAKPDDQIAAHLDDASLEDLFAMAAVPEEYEGEGSTRGHGAIDNP
jgi:hypothetical protein